MLGRSVMSNSATPWTVAHQAPLSMGILQATILEQVATPASRGSSQLRDTTQVSLQADSWPSEPPEKPILTLWGRTELDTTEAVLAAAAAGYWSDVRDSPYPQGIFKDAKILKKILTNQMQ